MSRGSSCSRESFRDEEIPAEEVDSVEFRGLWEEDARDANSRESRVCADACSPYRDMVRSCHKLSKTSSYTGHVDVKS